MPHQPQWFQHVPSAIDQIRRFPGPVLDRSSLEKMLHVSRREAIRLLHRFGGYQAGRMFLIGREDLLQALEAVSNDDAFRHETRRRQRLSDDLENTRRDLQSRQVKLPVARESFSDTSLPSGIRIVQSGVLQVEFCSAEDLLGRLYELVQTAGHDFNGFSQLVNPT
jgi:hypothetical protein